MKTYEKHNNNDTYKRKLPVGKSILPTHGQILLYNSLKKHLTYTEFRTYCISFSLSTGSNSSNFIYHYINPIDNILYTFGKETWSTLIPFPSHSNSPNSYLWDDCSKPQNTMKKSHFLLFKIEFLRMETTLSMNRRLPITQFKRPNFIYTKCIIICLREIFFWVLV